MTASPFVIQWVPAIAARVAAPRRALDVAMGEGRHSIVLARAGFDTFGVDRNFASVRTGVRLASEEGVRVAAWCADLTAYPLPRSRFDLVLVTRYLQRNLIAALHDTLAPGGYAIYETFTVEQRIRGTGPRSPDHLLQLGELRQLFHGWEIEFYQEVRSPEAVARIVARRLSRS